MILMVFGKLNFRNAKLAALVIVGIFALSAFVGFGGLGTMFPVSNASSSCTPASYPCSSSIQLSDFESGSGIANDQAAVAALNAGQISSYDFQLTPSEVSSLPSTYSKIGVPNSLYEVQVNPENTSWSSVAGFTGTAFNPFYYPQVRAAFNYLIDRSYLVDTVLGGAGVATVSVYGVAPDVLTVANGTALYQSYLTDNIALANSTIYKALTAVSGVTYTNHAYEYNGSPITIYVADRKDDPFRSQWAGAVIANLKQVGFAVVDESFTLALAQTTVFVENPVSGTGGSPPTAWDLYFGAYSGVYLYYGDNLQVCFDGANCAGASAPYSDNLTAANGGASPAQCSINDCAVGVWNTLAQTPPDVVKLSDKLDQLNNQILAGSYTTLAERAAILTNYTELEIQMGVNDWAATGFNVYGANPAQLTGLTPQVTTSPILNTESFMTMTSTKPIGVRYLTQYSINPVGLTASADAYSADILAAEFPQPAASFGAGTGYPVPFGWTYTINGYSPTASIAVPTSAVTYNANSTIAPNGWLNVTSGTKANLDLTVNFANIMNHDGFADNEPITMADIIYPYIIANNVTVSNNPMYVGAIAGLLGNELNTIKGFRVLNSTSIELYSSYFFVDPAEAVQTTVGNFAPMRDVQFPWTMWVAMSKQIRGQGGTNVWAASQANSTFPELTLVGNGAEGSSTDIANIATSLGTLSSAGYVPAQLTTLSAMFPNDGIAPTGAQATTRYNDAKTFITTTVGSSNALIGLGPMYLSAWSATTTPYTATLTANPNFHLGPYLDPRLFATAGVISVSTTVPTTVSIGNTIPMQTLLTPLGSSTAAAQSGVNVTVQLVNSTSVVSQSRFLSGANGDINYTVPSVPLGSYSVIVYASSVNDTIIIPQTYSTLVAAPSSSSSSTTTSSSSTSTTTPISTTTLEIIAAVVVVVVIAAAVALFLRRRPAAT
jgi:peptide/nickel transport system substrate-binding protein